MNILTILGCLLMLASECCGGGKSPDWEYQYEVKSPGTRSEFIVGLLTYKGTEIPQQLGHIVTPLGEFLFVQKLAWAGPVSPKWVPSTPDAAGNRPYFRESAVKELLAGKNELFRSTAIKDQPTQVSGEAALAGKLESRPKNVGVDWFFAVDQTLWINPEKMEAAMKDVVAKSLKNNSSNEK